MINSVHGPWTEQATIKLEIVHVDVCSPWCLLERDIFFISSMTRIDIWYIYLMRKKYEMIEIINL
jgi:hypothetical protein